MKRYPLFYPYVPKRKILREIGDSLSGRYIGQGPKVDKFEKAFGEKFGYRYPIFLNSGTAALELAYHLIGIKRGDEVIVPVLNFTGGQNGLLRRGAKIVFADIERKTLTLDPEDLKRRITRKTRAIVAVHLGGISVDRKIYKIAKINSIPVIVDLAQDMGPRKGARGNYLVYSFQAIKPITTADGGMLVLRNKKEYQRAKKLRWFGIDRERKHRNDSKPWQKREATFSIEEPGYKFQPTDIDACFGLAALPDLDKVIDHRAKLAGIYTGQLHSMPQIEIVRGQGDSHWLFCILAQDRDRLAEFLMKYGIETNLVHHRNDAYKIFGGKRCDLPNMDWAESRYLCLPINSKISGADVRSICARMKSFYERQ